MHDILPSVVYAECRIPAFYVKCFNASCSCAEYHQTNCLGTVLISKSQMFFDIIVVVVPQTTSKRGLRTENNMFEKKNFFSCSEDHNLSAESDQNSVS